MVLEEQHTLQCLAYATHDLIYTSAKSSLFFEFISLNKTVSYIYIYITIYLGTTFTLYKFEPPGCDSLKHRNNINTDNTVFNGRMQS